MPTLESLASSPYSGPAGLMGSFGFYRLYPVLGPDHCPRREGFLLEGFGRVLCWEIPEHLKGLSSVPFRKENSKIPNYTHRQIFLHSADAQLGKDGGGDE